ncbi:Uncharacterised protein [Mycobacteroides abscessus subsp. abscessus]|nr:Uncharacterised protein [Mycobacteroides abscessus subsp. abscessus]
MHRVCDVVRPVHDLCFDALPIARRTPANPRQGVSVVVVRTELAGRWPAQPRVLERCVQRRAGQVQPRRSTIGVEQFRFESSQDAQVLRVALEPADIDGYLVECSFAVVPVRRMPDVVSETGEFDEIGLAAETDRDPASDLPHLERMREAGARCITLAWSDDLGLVRKPTQCGRMEYARTVARVLTAVICPGTGQAGCLRALTNDALDSLLAVLSSRRYTGQARERGTSQAPSPDRPRSR